MKTERPIENGTWGEMLGILIVSILIGICVGSHKDSSAELGGGVALFSFFLFGHLVGIRLYLQAILKKLP